ncbi:hypothetical protein A2917_02165 [Candidatus Nomurabacteria bacterium RIFCSPLOWO2_01_FULL_42_17]|uniref:Prepilin-type N-terminal cleavage/methylation domain-containing protein n=1 Tax=Candidatus Nomurabacteria bacterium RIFCSPLOWO2_01_FULL_42_17 TaxID=1801780 RepID=A0A1F6XMX1_9BACT|nr:MAG: hypothetical protein A2917_02165 [Candidatus Nomurabacteria bacterium RIFCSPLOWO2_01_FULL_42_17]
MQKNNYKTKGGYTIIETMIAVSLFVVIVLSGMGALLNANLLHNKSQDMRSIMDNLSFIMEDMSRNLRTGYMYHCGDFSNIDTARSCELGGNIFFEEAPHGDPSDEDDQWGYKIESTDGGLTFNISKSTKGGEAGTWVQLNPPEVVIDGASGFTVVGAEPHSEGDEQQPFITIKLVGHIMLKDPVTPFSLQTSVSQRLLDISDI